MQIQLWDYCIKIKGFMEKISTLIEVKVSPCTMSKGFHMWWRVGVSEILNS